MSNKIEDESPQSVLYEWISMVGLKKFLIKTGQVLG